MNIEGNFQKSLSTLESNKYIHINTQICHVFVLLSWHIKNLARCLSCSILFKWRPEIKICLFLIISGALL